MPKLNAQYDIPENIHVQLHHLHKGNSTVEQRGNVEYVTLVKFIDGDTEVSRAIAKCNPKDSPNRKRGRDIAIARAKKQYFKSLNPE